MDFCFPNEKNCLILFICANYDRFAILVLPPLMYLILAVAGGSAVVEAVPADCSGGGAQPAPADAHQILAVTPLVGVGARVGAQLAHLAGLGAEAAHLAAFVGPP